MSTQSKVVVITGASSGIGEALALEYAQQGFAVYACGRNQAKLDALSEKSANITPCIFDLNDKNALKNALPKDLAIDHLILNAGTCEYIDNPKQFDGALFERVIQTNLIAVGYCLEAWLKQMKFGGQVGLMSSSAAYVPLTRAEAYGASKAGITYLAKTLSVDLEPQEIGISVIHPGFVKTPLTDKNDFDMPGIIEAEDAAKAIYKGMSKSTFDIHFPKGFTWTLKVLSLLPFSLWRPLAKRMIKT
ncbi:MAG: short-chain dehydrogenase [Pseudoalteromonas sp.]|nr:short-chain dehydrogenase [Pseudoalteromonas sp.]|tara:strand:- start:111 stop:848 length:738 start_codon:yes stop_codon:yes gene_type:complete